MVNVGKYTSPMDAIAAIGKEDAILLPSDGPRHLKSNWTSDSAMGCKTWTMHTWTSGRAEKK